MPDLGGHAGGGHDEGAGAAGDVGVHVDHVGPVAERRVDLGHRVDALGHRQALAGERGLRHLEGRRAQQPAVGRHQVARLDVHHVTGDEVLGGELDEPPVPAGLRLDDHHLLQRRHRGGGLAFLLQAEHRVEQGQRRQDEAGAVLLERPDAAEAGDQEHDLHEVGVLPEERPPAGLLLALGEPVRAERPPPLLGLSGAQPALLVDLLGRQSLGDRERVEVELRGHRGARTRLRTRHGRRSSSSPSLLACVPRGIVVPGEPKWVRPDVIRVG